MWRWLFTLIPILCSPGLSSTARADADTDLLFQDARKAFAAGQHQEAVNLLTQLTEKYPAAEGSLDAHWFLGRSRLALHQPKQAIAPLRHYIEARDATVDGQRARLDLVRAYVEIGKHDEAYLTAQTAIARGRKIPGFSPELRQEAILWKAQALLGLKRRKDAEAAADSVEKERKSALPTVQAHASWVKLQLTLELCAKFPPKGRLDEEALHDQIDRRGNCLLDATLVFLKGLATPNPEWSDASNLAYEKAAESYHQLCAHPPDPPGKRTAQELRQYHLELAPLLLKDCRRKSSQAIDLIEKEKDQLPRDAIPYINRSAERLKEIWRAS